MGAAYHWPREARNAASAYSLQMPWAAQRVSAQAAAGEQSWRTTLGELVHLVAGRMRHAPGCGGPPGAFISQHATAPLTPHVVVRSSRSASGRQRFRSSAVLAT